SPLYRSFRLRAVTARTAPRRRGRPTGSTPWRHRGASAAAAGAVRAWQCARPRFHSDGRTPDRRHGRCADSPGSTRRTTFNRDAQEVRLRQVIARLSRDEDAGVLLAPYRCTVSFESDTLPVETVRGDFEAKDRCGAIRQGAREAVAHWSKGRSFRSWVIVVER